MRVLNVLMLVALLELIAALPLQAQRSGIVGTVADTLGAMLSGVRVELTGVDFSAITNQSGEFKLTKVKPGPYTLTMRRIGYEALSMKIDIKAGEPMELDFELTPTVVRLAGMETRAEFNSKKLERVGFENRQKTSGIAPSRFLTRADIEKRNPLSLIHLLERQGGRVRNCIDALVYIDGVPPPPALDNIGVNSNQPQPRFSRNSSARNATRSESNNNMEYRALESIPPKTVEGMEIYASVSEIPAEFRPGGNAAANGRCVILLWTRDR